MCIRDRELEAQLADRKVTIELSDEARAWLGNKGYSQDYGARPLARVIQAQVKKPLAEELLFGKLSKGGVVVVGVDQDTDTLTFSYPEADEDEGATDLTKEPAA